MRLFVPPIALAVLVVSSAPFMGKLQKMAKDSLESGLLVRLLTLTFVLGALIVVAWVAHRSRLPAGEGADPGSATRSGSRRQALGWVLTGCMMVALQIASSTRGSASAAAYERLHFVIYGLLAILFYRAFISKLPRAWSALSTAAAVVGVGVGDEGLQWLVPLRTGEFFDLGLNLYGGVAGLLIAQALPAELAVGSVAARRSASVLVGLVLASVTLFIDRAHLGYEIAVPGVGNFRSFFSEQELSEVNADRASRWQRQMPVLPLRKALDIEDYFLTEAGWHVGLRNRARREGDTDLVWRETEILSRFYPATLEIPDGNWFRYRLPEAEQRRLDAYTPTDRAYSSHADNGRIWVLPRFVVVLALCCSVILAGALWRLAG